MAGDAGGGGRRGGWQAPPEPWAEAAEGDAARSPDLTTAEPLHEALHTGLEGAGCPALLRGDRTMRMTSVSASHGDLMEELKLPVNAEDDSVHLEFLGYRLSPKGEGELIGTRPSQATVGNCRPDQRVDGAEERDSAAGPDGGTPEPCHDGVGELLWPWAGQPGLPSDRAAVRLRVALSEAQGEVRGDSAPSRTRGCGRTTASLARTKSFPWAKSMIYD